MAKRFLHLGVSFEFTTPRPRPSSRPGASLKDALTIAAMMAPTDPLTEAQRSIQAILDKAKDWIRYAPNCWILYTSVPASTWYERLIEIPGMKDHLFFVCEIDLRNRSGWLSGSVWEWLKKTRD